MRAAWVLAAVWTAIVPGGSSPGESGMGMARAGVADVWLISTRRLPCAACAEDREPDFWRLSAAAEWIDADRKAFLKSDQPPVPTIFFIHGNRYRAEEAVEDGMNFCEELKCLAPDARFRYVIWSWPSERISIRSRPDVVAKNTRSQHEAVYVARLLDRIHPETPVSLVGFSYGAQTIVGVLELLAGGCYAGCTLDRHGPPRRAPLSGVLVAAATENNVLESVDAGLSPLGPVDRLLVTSNGCDFTLRFYPRLYPPHGPGALGFTGPVCVDPGDRRWKKVETIDVACEVGRRHDWDVYRQAGPLMARLAYYTLLKQD